MAFLVKNPGPSGIVVESEDFSASRWSLTAVPIPAAAWLFGPAVSLLAPWVKRRARDRAAALVGLHQSPDGVPGAFRIGAIRR